MIIKVIYPGVFFFQRIMSGFDDPGIFYSDSFGGDPVTDEGQIRKSQLQKRFKEFLRQYRIGTDRTGFSFKYRCPFSFGKLETVAYSILS